MKKLSTIPTKSENGQNHKWTPKLEVVQYSNHKKFSSFPTLSVSKNWFYSSSRNLLNFKDIADAIAIATATALDIQHKNDWKMTSVGVELRVKIAISAGKIYCTHVGMPGKWTD